MNKSKYQLTFHDIQNISQYLLSIKDIQCLEMCTKKFRGICNTFRSNSFSLTKKTLSLFPNITILYLYKSTDESFENDKQITKRINTYDIVSYQTFLKAKEKNYIYKKVKYTCQDIRLYGKIVPKEVRIMNDVYTDLFIDELTIPNSVLSIYSLCLSQSISIRRITVDDSWKLIGNRMVRSGKVLQTILLPKSIEMINGKEYQYIELDEYKIDETVTSLDDWCFSNAEYLKQLEIPSSVTSIGKYCFSTCFHLTSLQIPFSVTFIGENCLHGCRQLRELMLPFNWCNEGNRAFTVQNNTLYSLRLPSSLTLFNGKEVEMKDLTTFTLPKTVLHIYNNCFQYARKLTSFKFNSQVKSIGNECFDSCISLSELTIPSTITSLGKNCFMSCKKLTKIQLPNNLSSLPNGCFKECISLRSIQLSSQLQSIGDYCFHSCSSLKHFQLPNSITFLGKFITEGCREEIQQIVYSFLIDNNLF